MLYGDLRRGDVITVYDRDRFACENQNQFRGVDDGWRAHVDALSDRWVYGQAMVSGRANQWGWVWADCLEPAP